MARHDDEEDKPLDPAVEKVRRKLVRFVAINLGLLLLALMAVLAAIVYKTRTEAPPASGLPISEIPIPADGTVEGEIGLPAGARIASQSLSGSRLSLHVELPGGQASIYLYDLSERRLVGHFAVVPE